MFLNLPPPPPSSPLLTQKKHSWEDFTDFQLQGSLWTWEKDQCVAKPSVNWKSMTEDNEHLQWFCQLICHLTKAKYFFYAAHALLFNMNMFCAIWEFGWSRDCIAHSQNSEILQHIACNLLPRSHLVVKREATKRWWLCVVLIHCVISCKITEFRQW